LRISFGQRESTLDISLGVDSDDEEDYSFNGVQECITLLTEDDVSGKFKKIQNMEDDEDEDEDSSQD
jgi:hypothetical protein